MCFAVDCILSMRNCYQTLVNLVPRVFVPLDQRSENERLWEQPFQTCAIDADCAVKPDGQNSVISFVISKWLLPETLVFRRLVVGNEDSGNEDSGNEITLLFVKWQICRRVI